MTTTADESAIPAEPNMDWNQQRALTPFAAEIDSVAGPRSVPGAAGHQPASPSGLTVDQGLSQLLYQLAVRLPVQPDIQAVCVWLYEPVRQIIRLHVLMADFPGHMTASSDFPIDDAIAEWVWEHQLPLIINARAEKRFPDFARVLLQSGISLPTLYIDFIG